jgi:hypothetical protein
MTTNTKTWAVLSAEIQPAKSHTSQSRSAAFGSCGKRVNRNRVATFHSVPCSFQALEQRTRRPRPLRSTLRRSGRLLNAPDSPAGRPGKCLPTYRAFPALFCAIFTFARWT